MKRAEIINQKPYGVTEYEGATYILLQDAYGDWYLGNTFIMRPSQSRRASR